MVSNLGGMAGSFASVYLGDGGGAGGGGVQCEVRHTEIKFPEHSDERMGWKIMMFDDVYGLGFAVSKKGVYLLHF